MTRGWRARAPLRADLAGGTLDLWPLYLLHPDAMTVNVALSLQARVTYRGGGERWLLRAGDHGRRRSVAQGRVAEAARNAPAGDPFALVLHALAECSPLPPGCLTTTVQGPPGGGLGGSSALLIALMGLLARLGGLPPLRRRGAERARDLEARVLGFPTGTQDHYPAIHGGVLALRYRVGGAAVQRLPADRRALADRLVLAYSGRPHASAPTNWRLFCRRIEGDPVAVRCFARIARAGSRAAEALGEGDWRGLAAAMNADWLARRELDPRLAPRPLLRLEQAARQAGVAAAKCCGAASGGCMLFLLRRPDDRPRVEAALREAGGALLPVRIPARGLVVERIRP